ncbi:MAG: cytochrome c-type biogenesis protein CcmH [Methylococcaceae bacterium]|nr:cytochrome c-type biogenesis protein CcmH [Methylococcaceae bacterium]
MFNRLIVFLFFLVSAQVYAVDTHQLPNPEQQKTYESIISELRCLVCQNQTIADSNAELAADLRRQVYDMLMQGKSKDEIHQFMTERYGDFVLYNPPFKAKTGFLWLGPVLFLVIGLIMIIWFIRRKKQATVAVVDKDKQEKVRRLLASDNEDRS